MREEGRWEGSVTLVQVTATLQKTLNHHTSYFRVTQGQWKQLWCHPTEFCLVMLHLNAALVEMLNLSEELN